MAFEKIKKFISRKKEIPGDLWMKCPDCKGMIFKKEVEDRKKVCTECQYHFTITPAERLDLMVDAGTFQEMWTDLASVDALKFEGDVSYKKKLASAMKETGQKDACVVGTGKISDREAVVGMTDSRFMMGSMGSVLGEKVTRAFEIGDLAFAAPNSINQQALQQNLAVFGAQLQFFGQGIGQAQQFGQLGNGGFGALGGAGGLGAGGLGALGAERLHVGPGDQLEEEIEDG